MIERLGELLRPGPHTISPTAHYTGFVWARNGLGPHQLATREGALFYHGLRPLMALSAAIGGPTVEGFLLARHRLIDTILTDAIDRGVISQVVEIATGMSPRGERFTATYGDQISYLEADLPAMAARKRDALATLGPQPPSHRVVDLDVLSTDANSLASVIADLDPQLGTAFITEGLVNYLPRPKVTEMWGRIAAAAAGFPVGLYLSDVHLASENAGPLVRLYAKALGAFVRGKIYLQFSDVDDASAALKAAGFDSADVLRAEEPTKTAAQRAATANVRIIQAWLRSRTVSPTDR